MWTPRIRGAQDGHSRWTQWILTLVGLACLSAGLVGCRRTLFAQEPYRSPYERHDRLLNEHAEPHVFDAFGKRRPNLRGRLAPKE